MKGIHARYSAYLVAKRHTDTVIKSVRNTTPIHNYTTVVVLKWIHKTPTALLGRRSSNSPRSSPDAKDTNKKKKSEVTRTGCNVQDSQTNWQHWNHAGSLLYLTPMGCHFLLDINHQPTSHATIGAHTHTHTQINDPAHPAALLRRSS